MRLDAYLDVDQAVARYLELIKVAALIERDRDGQTLDDGAARGERDARPVRHARAARDLRGVRRSTRWLRDTERDPAERAGPVGRTAPTPSLEPFIPRRGRGLMLSASDIDTYRICPLKYKFARVFRDPAGADDPPALRDRHAPGAGALPHRRAAAVAARGLHASCSRASWRRSGFGDSDDELQFRERAVDGARALLASRPRRPRPSRSGSSAASPSRSARTCCAAAWTGSTATRTARYELIDYKTGKAKTAEELREDVQLSLYQMGARESWRLETSAQSYFYVLTGEKVPVEHSRGGARAGARDGLRDRRRDPQAAVRAHALARDLPLLRLPDHLPSR